MEKVVIYLLPLNEPYPLVRPPLMGPIYGRTSTSKAWPLGQSKQDPSLESEYNSEDAYLTPDEQSTVVLLHRANVRSECSNICPRVVYPCQTVQRYCDWYPDTHLNLISQTSSMCPQGCHVIRSVDASASKDVKLSKEVRVQKIKWMAVAKLNAAKMKYVFHAICDRAGGTAHASAKLNTQLVAGESETALPRTRMGKISAGYIHETGPTMTANEETNR